MKKNIIGAFVRLGNRNKVRKQKIDKLFEKRNNLKKDRLKVVGKLKDPSLSIESLNVLRVELLNINNALDRTHRYSYVRYRKLCGLTSSSRGVKFGIRRNFVRHYAGFSQIAGLSKV